MRNLKIETRELICNQSHINIHKAILKNNQIDVPYCTGKTAKYSLKV